MQRDGKWRTQLLAPIVSLLALVDEFQVFNCVSVLYSDGLGAE